MKAEEQTENDIRQIRAEEIKNRIRVYTELVIKLADATAAATNCEDNCDMFKSLATELYDKMQLDIDELFDLSMPYGFKVAYSARCRYAAAMKQKQSEPPDEGETESERKSDVGFCGGARE